MEKFSFTSAGIAALGARLRESDEVLRLSESVAAATDLRSWLMGQFALGVFQLEFLRTLPEEVVLLLGWGVASAIVQRAALTVLDTDALLENGRCNPACFSFSMQCHAVPCSVLCYRAYHRHRQPCIGANATVTAAAFCHFLHPH